EEPRRSGARDDDSDWAGDRSLNVRKGAWGRLACTLEQARCPGKAMCAKQTFGLPGVTTIDSTRGIQTCQMSLQQCVHHTQTARRSKNLTENDCITQTRR